MDALHDLQADPRPRFERMNTLLASLPLFLVPQAGAPGGADLTIDHVDFYGIRTVDPVEIEGALGFEVGDPSEVDKEAVRGRLIAIEGVRDAVVIGMRIPGSVTLLVGIQEDGAAELELRPQPEGEVPCPEGLVEAYTKAMDLGYEGMMKGVSGEEIVDGHSFSEYEPVRELEHFLAELAFDRPDELLRVLHESRDATQRTAAAKAASYLDDKQLVVEALGHAMTDPDPSVRNNAVRALSVLAQWANGQDDFRVELDPGPALAMLESLQWTDRNKGAALLYRLSEGRDPELLAQLREASIPALAEMALWHSVGHATYSVVMLGRLAGHTDEEVKAKDAAARAKGDEAHRTFVNSLRAKAEAAKGE